MAPVVPTKNGEGLEEPPLAMRFTTVTLAVPMAAMSAAVKSACRLVFEMKVVGRALPFQATTEVGKKFIPVTATLNAGPPATAELGVISVMVGGGVWMTKVSGPDVPPPGAGLETVIVAVPGVAISAALIAACRLVLDPNVVVRAAPFH